MAAGKHFRRLWPTLRRRYRAAPHGCKTVRLKQLKAAVTAQLKAELGRG